ncbi:hypothetical protein JZ751_021082 [Albula glossodonta]|uniref:Uncharacterized protein n=1 Tax=Albula glossodonta TaxID=121402 RepID=A0A8T2PNQ3_9TELE|nr:hypothetical protein JZ751_021082 [Albula glossodonta]
MRIHRGPADRIISAQRTRTNEAPRTVTMSMRATPPLKRAWEAGEASGNAICDCTLITFTDLSPAQSWVPRSLLNVERIALLWVVSHAPDNPPSAPPQPHHHPEPPFPLLLALPFPKKPENSGQWKRQGDQRRSDGRDRMAQRVKDRESYEL